MPVKFGEVGHAMLAGVLAISLSTLPVVASAAPPTAAPPVGGVHGEAPPADPAPACVPACREGFVCVEGACVSACNPPCPEGQTCTADAQCVASTPAPAPTATVDPQVQPTPGPTSASGACVSDNQCRHPRQCEAGQCTITQTYLDGLKSESKRAIITGSVMMGVGALIGLMSIVSFAAGNARHRRGESDDSAYIAGYSLVGIGGLVIIGGSIPLGIGTGKNRRWQAYSQERDAGLDWLRFADRRTRTAH